MIQVSLEKNSCVGFCRKCGRDHTLPFGNSVAYAREMMARFSVEQRLDYDLEAEFADPNLHFDMLLPGDRGHMFGVMECRDEAGGTVWLRAFSSLGTGLRVIPGWVPPIPDNEIYEQTVLPEQKLIKELTAQRNRLPGNDPERRALEDQRKEISRNLMPRIHDLYSFRNFRGEKKPLREVFPGKGGIPGGVGECCAPKMLNYAAGNNLTPVSLAEFFWGGSNKSGKKQPGEFFEACEEKCQPILGFMLCGLDDHG